MPLGNAVVFVTGGAGFVGSAVIGHLLDETDVSIVNIDKLTYASNSGPVSQVATSRRYRFAKVDICNGSALRQLFEQCRPRYVMNLAAESHVDRSIEGPADFIRTNVVGTFTLLEEAARYWMGLKPHDRDLFRLHHVSTDEVHGSLGSTGFFTEATAYAPNSPYAASKASSDHLVRAWRQTYGLPTIVTNCSNNFGPYQFPEKLVPHVIIRSLAGQPLPVYGDGRHVRDWLYVADHARALRLVLEQGRVGETYHIGARNERANIDVVRSICHLLDEMQPGASGARERQITHVPDRPGHDRRYAIDPSKIERELGWRARESFESGLAKTVRWYLDNQTWCQSILDRGYRPERIGQIRA